MKGYIKDYRQELQSDIWLMPPMYHRVWQFLKYMVNHETRTIPMDDGSTLEIRPGQHLTSVRKIAAGVGYYEQGAWKQPNPRTIQRILEWLKKNNMIETSTGHGNTRYTLVTLIQWESYQSKETEGNSKTTVSTQSVQRNKNVKNDKELTTTTDSVLHDHESNTQAKENPFHMYELAFNKFPSGMISDQINHYLNDGMEEKVIATAIYKAGQNGQNWPYAKGILNNWQRNGVFTYEQVEEEQASYKRKKEATPFKAINGGKHNGLSEHDEQPKLDFSKRKRV